MSDDTRLIHAHGPSAPLDKTVGPPIQKGSTVLMASAADLYDEDLRTYGRAGLSAQDALIEGLKVLENAAAVTLYPSGVAAIAGAAMAILKAGDEILVVDNAYKPTRRFCDQVLARFGVTTHYFPARTPPEMLVESASAETRLIFLESPGSLTFEMQDAPAIARLARAKGILTAIDNTWAAGLLFRPLDHGIDISIQSLTKYVGGHSDIFMGSVAVNDAKLAAALAKGIDNMGWAVSGEDAYGMLRGLRTLPVRLARHGQNALEIARWLAARPEVAEVLHPALPGHPDHELWARDYSSASGLFSFVLRAGDKTASDAFLDALRLFGLGFSWGGYESLALGCDDQLKVRQEKPSWPGPVIRLSIGLEDPVDLIADLEHGLAAAAGGR